MHPDFDRLVKNIIKLIPETEWNLPISLMAKQIGYTLNFYNSGTLHYSCLLNLLRLSLNQQTLSSLHVSFVSILNQISEDEILLLKTTSRETNRIYSKI